MNSYSVEDPSAASITPTNAVTLSQDRYTITATKTGSADFTFLATVCTGSGNSKEFNGRIPILFVPYIDAYAEAIGDPHFRQPVIDQLTGKIKEVCYDIKGSGGDILNIIGFKKNNIQVFGELKDDYYMHKIFIPFLFENITITPAKLFIGKHRQIKWEKENKVLKSKYFNFIFQDTKIYLSSNENFPFNEPFKMIIESGIHSLSELHLDVSFKYSVNEYPFMTGIIGKLGQKKISFFNNVQMKNYNLAQNSIILDGKLFKSHLIYRKEKECWFLEAKNFM